MQPKSFKRGPASLAPSDSRLPEMASVDMGKDPWTDPDPQSGDFDTELDRACSDQVEIHEGNPDAKLSLLVSIKGDDAKRLEQIATERGQQPGEVVSQLLRSA